MEDKDASCLYSGVFPRFDPGLCCRSRRTHISRQDWIASVDRRLSLSGVECDVVAWSWREWLRCSKQPISGRLPFPTERPRDGGVAEAPPREQQVGGMGTPEHERAPFTRCRTLPLKIIDLNSG